MEELREGNYWMNWCNNWKINWFHQNDGLSWIFLIFIILISHFLYVCMYLQQHSRSEVYKIIKSSFLPKLNFDYLLGQIESIFCS